MLVTCWLSFGITTPIDVPIETNDPSASTDRTIALDYLQPKQLLTIHYMTSNLVGEYLKNRPSMLQHYYTKQHNASVLIYAPYEEIVDVVERITLLPAMQRSYNLTTRVSDEHGRRGLAMFGPLMQWKHSSGVEFLFMGARVEPPSNLDNNTVAHCSGRTWSRQYVLHAGVQAGYHMLRLPPLKWYDFIIKMDTDIAFIKDMEDLGARLATSAHVQVMHTSLVRTHGGPDSCDRGVGSLLEVYMRRHADAPARTGGVIQDLPWWCREPMGYVFYGNFVGFRTSFLLAPATQALSAFFYNQAWKVYFESRGIDQSVYMALVCNSLYMPDIARPPHNNSWVLNMHHLRDTVFSHGNKRRNFRSAQPSMRNYTTTL